MVDADPYEDLVPEIPFDISKWGDHPVASPTFADREVSDEERAAIAEAAKQKFGEPPETT